MKTMRPAAVVLMLVALAACGEPAAEPTPPEQGALLEPPPPGEGIQLTTGDFEVEAGSEIQDCYFFRVSDIAEQAGIPPDEVILRRTQMAQRDGSHHMNIFRVRTILALSPDDGPISRSKNTVGPCADSVNWADWPLLANSQEGDVDWTFPEGVGNELMADEWIMLQTHYVNANTQKTPGLGRVDANLWVMPRSELVHQMGTLFATKQSIRICVSNPKPKFSGTCQFNSDVPTTIVGANGHFHSRGKEFGMYAWDGMSATTPPESARFYTSLSWDDPPMAHSPELLVDVPANGGIWYTCEYEWYEPPIETGCAGLDQLDKELFNTPDDQLDCCYTFGNTVESAEHCNVFAYYYPKQDDVNCF
jgi:hypothetical protein